ncbi:MAG: HNH endonuclease, partial [Bdellovibrionota bacterium]
SSMRLIRAVPEVKEQIQAGSLSLSSATQLQGFFVEEKKHGREYDRREVIGKVQGLSRRECEKKLFEISPTAIPKERERVLSDSKTEIKLILTEEVMEQLKELKSILAHALPNATYSELVGYLANQVLIKIKSPSTSTPPAGQTEKFRSTSTRRYLPRLLVRLIRQRAAWSCEYVADDGKRCTSQHALQVDHITPLALGGTNDPENLRLLCRAHNLQQASLKLGPVLMSRYLRLLKP